MPQCRFVLSIWCVSVRRRLGDSLKCWKRVRWLGDLMGSISALLAQTRNPIMLVFDLTVRLASCNVVLKSFLRPLLTLVTSRGLRWFR